MLLNRLCQLLEEVPEFEVHFARDERGEHEFIYHRTKFPLFADQKLLNTAQLIYGDLRILFKPLDRRLEV